MKHLITTAFLISLTACGGETIIKGEKGDQGVPGLTGQAGSNGADGKDGADGSDGKDGVDGVNGVDGLNGTSCTVSSVSPGVEAPYGGALITCGPSSTLLLNGEPGPQGQPGPISPNALSQIIDPCGNAPGIYDEVLLKLQSGKVLASFSDNANGYNTRLSEITQGNYVTTDGSNCHFSVDSLGNVSW